jgi:DNA-binding winged helix-turn-helix (wHTH) protein
MRVVFGECEFDSRRRLVLRRGRAMALSAKAFQFLELLLTRRPEAIPKAELLQLLWPDTFVADAGLHNLVAEIRAALGDTPRAPRYIRTVPRFGYAFHGEARQLPPVNVPAEAPSKARLVSGAQEWLLADGSHMVGRDRDCAVRIDSATLSRHHARIVVTAERTTIEDLGSKNGTRVNGKLLEHLVSLKDHDEIQAGSVTITYRSLEPLASTVTRQF